jgi:MtN3 and saliva related transmembrane protein
MKELVAVIFGLGLGCNALLFVPQVVALWRKKSDAGISLLTFGGFSGL